MACASIGSGLWKDYTPLKALNKPVNRAVCNGDAKKLYENIYRIFRLANDQQSDIGDYRANHLSETA
jgi:hypothetical protein